MIRRLELQRLRDQHHAPNQLLHGVNTIEYRDDLLLAGSGTERYKERDVVHAGLLYHGLAAGADTA